MVMPERVVDVLEAVEVQDEDSHQPVIGACASERGRETVVKVRAVGQPGERVVGRLVLVDDRLPPAEFDGYQRYPQQGNQPDVVGGDHQKDRHQCHQDDGARELEGEVGAHVVERARPIGESGRGQAAVLASITFTTRNVPIAATTAGVWAASRYSRPP